MRLGRAATQKILLWFVRVAPTCRLSPATPQLNGLYSGYLSALDREAEQSADKVPPVVTAGTGVHVKQPERGISYHLQNMGMTADEETRPQAPEVLSNPRVIVAGIASYVCHIYSEPFAFPVEIAR
jgi:hypothetical protein